MSLAALAVLVPLVWSAPVVLIKDQSGGTRGAPALAVDPAGNAIAVWTDTDWYHYQVMASRYDAGGGWGPAEPVMPVATYPAGNPAVALDADGNAIAVWQQTDGVRASIWTSRAAPGAGWEAPQLLETDDAADAAVPQIAMTDDGDAIAVWRQSDGVRPNIWANHYVAGAGWGTAELIEHDDVGDAFEPQIAVDQAGDGIAVWRQFDGSHDNIWANRYVAGAGWGNAALIEHDDTGQAAQPAVAVTPDGDAVAVWHQSDGSYTTIRANRFTVAAGWGTAQMVEQDSGNAFSPRVAIDQAGNAIAVWRQWDAQDRYLHASFGTADGAWSAAQRLDLGDAPAIALDPARGVVVVWRSS